MVYPSEEEGNRAETKAISRSLSILCSKLHRGSSEEFRGMAAGPMDILLRILKSKHQVGSKARIGLEPKHLTLAGQFDFNSPVEKITDAEII